VHLRLEGRRIHSPLIEPAAVGTRPIGTLSILLRTALRLAEIAAAILPLRLMREAVEIRRTPSLMHLRLLAAMHLRPELRPVLREAMFALTTKPSMMVMVVHPRTTWAILREAAFALTTKSFVVMMMHPRATLAVLCEALPTKSFVVVMMHPRGHLAVLLKALSTLPTKSFVMVMVHPRATLAVLREAVPTLPAKSFVIVMVHPRPTPAILRKALSALRSHRSMMMLHARALRSRLRPLILRTRLRTILRLLLAPLHFLGKALTHLLATLHLLRKPLAPLLLKLLLALLPRLRPAVLRARVLAAGVGVRRPGSALIHLRRTHSRLAGLLRLPIAITRTALHRASTELRGKFIARHPPIAATVEFLQDFRRILHFLLIDHPIVIRIQQIEERRPAVHIARPTPALTIRPVLIPIAPLRQAGRRIRWRRWSLCILRSRRGGRCRGSRAFLRVEQRCRQRQRNRGGEKHLQFHKAWNVLGKAAPATVLGFIS